MRIVDENEITALRTERIRARLDAEDAGYRMRRRAPSHRFIRPKTRRRWLPPVLTAMASGALTLAIVNFTHLDGTSGPPVDNHPTVSQIVNGYGQPIPVPAPSLMDNSSSKTTKSPAATSGDATTGQIDTTDTAHGHMDTAQEVAQDARRSTSGGGSSVTTGSKSSGATSGSTSGSSGSGKGSGSKPAATSQPSSPSGSGGGGSATTPPAGSDPEPTPAPTQDAGPVSTLLGGVGTVVGDLGDTVGGTLDGVGGLLGGG